MRGPSYPETSPPPEEEWAPCLRMVVSSSDCVPRGTVFVVTQEGAQLGRSDLTPSLFLLPIFLHLTPLFTSEFTPSFTPFHSLILYTYIASSIHVYTCLPTSLQPQSVIMYGTDPDKNEGFVVFLGCSCFVIEPKAESNIVHFLKLPPSLPPSPSSPLPLPSPREPGGANPISVREVQVSKAHVDIRFSRTNGCFTLCDLASQNGTFLNNTRISEVHTRHGQTSLSNVHSLLWLCDFKSLS